MSTHYSGDELLGGWFKLIFIGGAVGAILFGWIPWIALPAFMRWFAPIFASWLV